MATQAEVVALVTEQGLHPTEAAKQLGITPSGVYGHLRRAGLGRASRNGRARRGGGSNNAGAAGPPPVEQMPGPVPVAPPGMFDGDPFEDLRQRQADLAEHLDSELTIKRQEISTLEGRREALLQSIRDLAAVA